MWYSCELRIYEAKGYGVGFVNYLTLIAVSFHKRRGCGEESVWITYEEHSNINDCMFQAY